MLLSREGCKSGEWLGEEGPKDEEGGGRRRVLEARGFRGKAASVTREKGEKGPRAFFCGPIGQCFLDCDNRHVC